MLRDERTGSTAGVHASLPERRKGNTHDNMRSLPGPLVDDFLQADTSLLHPSAKVPRVGPEVGTTG